MKRSTAIAAIFLGLGTLGALAQTAPAPAKTAPAATTSAVPAPVVASPATPSPVAATGGEQGKRWQACQADLQKLCGTVDRSVRGAIRDCLKAHAADLSDGCKTSIAERAAAHAAEKGGPVTTKQ